LYADNRRTAFSEVGRLIGNIKDAHGEPRNPELRLGLAGRGVSKRSAAIHRARSPFQGGPSFGAQSGKASAKGSDEDSCSSVIHPSGAA